MKRPQTADGFTLIELLIVVAVTGILAAIALPGLLMARSAADEASAIGSLRSINSAQATYSSTCGHGFYAPTLTELARAPENGHPNGFVSADLGGADTILKSRYTFTVGGLGDDEALPTCTGLGQGEAAGGYWATATPSSVGNSRYFALNTNGGIWEHDEAFSVVPEFGALSEGTPLR